MTLGIRWPRSGRRFVAWWLAVAGACCAALLLGGAPAWASSDVHEVIGDGTRAARAAALPPPPLATADAITCVAPTAKQWQVLYVETRGQDPAMFSADLPRLRRALERASSFIDLRSQDWGDGHGARFPFACTGDGQIQVQRVVLPITLDPGQYQCGAGFDAMTSALRAAGHVSKTRKYVVYWGGSERPAGEFLRFMAGCSQIPGGGGSSLPDASNPANTGGSFSVQNRGNPGWKVLAHEMTHGMGIDHCGDSEDVMCRGAGSFCPELTFDCGGDTYFNPAPGGNSKLALQWNLAASYNAFLTHRSPSTVPLVAPENLYASHVLPGWAVDRVLTLAWNPIPGASEYELSCWEDGGLYDDAFVGWRIVVRTAGTTGSGPVSCPAWSVRAIDAAGRRGARGESFAFGQYLGEVSSPVSLRIRHLRSDSVLLSWSPVFRPGGAATYRIWRGDQSGTSDVLLGTTSVTSFRDVAPISDELIRYYVTALRADGTDTDRTSTGSVTVRAPSSQMPRNVRVISVAAGNAVTLGWDAPRAPAGLLGYSIKVMSSNWSPHFVDVPADRSTATIPGLTLRTGYRFSVEARYTGARVASEEVFASTPADPVPPPAVAVKISTRLFSGTRALRCRAARPCRISRTAKLSAKGTLSTRKAVTMKFVVQRQVRRNGRLVWKRVTLVTFAASGGTYRRALPRRPAGRYRMRVETVASPAVKRSVGGFVHFVLR